MAIDAVAFDLGETLIYFDAVALSWQEHYRTALERVADACHRQPTEAQITVAESILERANGRLYPRIVELTTEAIWGGITTALGADATAREIAEATFFEYFLLRRSLYPDTLPVLERLKALGIPMGLLTDVPYGMSRTIAAKMLPEIEPYLSVWLTSVEVGYCKPDPRGLLLLSQRLEIPPARIAYVGNERKDVQAAKAAGMHAIWIDRTGAMVPEEADIRLSDLTELIDYVARQYHAL